LTPNLYFAIIICGYADLGIRRLRKEKQIKMSKKNIHIVQRENGWAVRRERAERDSSHHNTQAEAIEAGRETAARQNVEVLIHGRNGRIRERNSYGNDPFPPKG